MKIMDLSEEAFSLLLARLDADPIRAGEEYEKLRTRLIFFFERRSCRIPAELADETINRLARKLEEGIEIKEVSKYAAGVASRVLQEHWKDPNREWDQLDEQLSSPKSDQDLAEIRLECMKKCLQALPEGERDLIVKNCTLEKKGKEELAESLKLTITAFRIRVFRVRTKLHKCLEKCMKGA